jgi:hypothetical protein
MRYLHEKTGFVLRLALLTLLLAAQSLALTHELDHAGLPDNPQCAVCSLGGSLSGPIVVDHEAWDPTPGELAPIIIGRRLLTVRILTPPPARAPPSETLPAIA